MILLLQRRPLMQLLLLCLIIQRIQLMDITTLPIQIILQVLYLFPQIGVHPLKVSHLCISPIELRLQPLMLSLIELAIFLCLM